MERRYRVRLQELIDDAVVRDQQLSGMLERLEEFVEPFAACVSAGRPRRLTRQYVAGLMSQVQRKNVESIAYLHDQDRQALQKFIGQHDWDHRPLIGELVRQVAEELGAPDAVIVFDPSGFAKKGTESVGVQRQWCGRLGKVENCQVGVYMAYAARREHVLVDTRLYLPQEWSESKKRRLKCGVPAEVTFHTRHELALEMLAEHASRLPHAWVAGDDEMGKIPWFRGELHARGERYLLAVPGNMLVRNLEVPPPALPVGRGRPRNRPWTRLDHLCGSLLPEAWTKIDVRDGDKGPLVIEAVMLRVQAKAAPQEGLEELLLIVRERQTDGTLKHDYYFSNAAAETPLAELARVSKEVHRVEECLQRAKGEAGLGDYEVRTWRGWHHHQTLSLVATWFLTQETRRGKKIHTGTDGSASPRLAGGTAA